MYFQFVASNWQRTWNSPKCWACAQGHIQRYRPKCLREGLHTPSGRLTSQQPRECPTKEALSSSRARAQRTNQHSIKTDAMGADKGNLYVSGFMNGMPVKRDTTTVTDSRSADVIPCCAAQALDKPAEGGSHSFPVLACHCRESTGKTGPETKAGLDS